MILRRELRLTVGAIFFCEYLQNKSIFLVDFLANLN